MKVISTAEKLPEKSRVDLAGAIAAGIGAGAVTSVIDAVYQELNPMAYANCIILAIATYLTVASLAQRFWPNSLERIAPVWVLTGFFGSVLFVVASLMPSIITGWHDSFRLDRSLTEYISTEFGAASSAIIVLSFVTLPITATFHYRGFVQAIKGWHMGAEPLSILDETALRRR